MPQTETDRLIERRKVVQAELDHIDRSLQLQELTDEALRCPGRAGAAHDWETQQYEQRIDYDRYHSMWSHAPLIMARRPETTVTARCRQCPARMTVTT